MYSCIRTFLFRRLRVNYYWCQLESRPPSVVVCFLGRIKQQFAAGVTRSFRPHVHALHVPHDHVGHVHGGVVSNVDAEASAVQTGWVYASREPEAIL